MRKLAGEYENGMWGAGTTIGSLQATLKKRGLTVASHPSVLGATLGSWIFTNSHGSGGGRWTPTLGKIKVFDTETCGVKLLADKETIFNDQQTTKQQRRYIVLRPSIDTRRTVLPSRVRIAYASGFIDSWIRRLFAAHFRRRAQRFVRSRVPLCDGHTTNVLGSVFPFGYFGSKLLPTLLTWWIHPNIWNRVTTLSRANHLISDPPYYTGLVAYMYTNFECFIKIQLNPEMLLGICNEIRDLFKRQRGRCEIRYEGRTLFLDFVVLCRNTRVVMSWKESLVVHITKGKYVEP